VQPSRHLPRALVVLLVGALVPGAASAVGSQQSGPSPTARAATCVAQGGTAAVARPQRVRNLPTGETGWFSSPSLVDLDGDGRLEIVAPFYSTFVFDAGGRRLAKAPAPKGRVYPPGVVADLEGDGVQDVVVAGGSGVVAAYEFRGGTLHRKAGWPASTRSGGQAPEARGLAAADLDGDGRVEVVATTTNTARKGAQVFVFDASGKPFQPAGAEPHAWPRNRGYGAYGENVGIGNIDDDPQLEVLATFDNHQINAFDLDGTSILASPWFTDPESEGKRLAWGDFIRWASAKVETKHYHLHRGAWPSPARQPWLQWTASPPSVADLDGDGHNEVIGLPNVEKHIPYRTQGYAFMVLDGAYGDGSRSAMRHPGFEKLVVSNRPVHRPDGDWYPPSGIPAPTVVDLTGDGRPEIVAALPGGRVYAVGPDGRRLWTRAYAPKRAKTFASEVVAADLNEDGSPELVFGTYSLHRNAGRLVVLSAGGQQLSVTKLRHQGRDGNGIGVAAAPSIADLTGDGTLEIVLTTFDHGVDVYTVPGSGTGCLPWPTGRGSLLRNGMGPATAP
jgi:hypothetical protein